MPRSRHCSCRDLRGSLDQRPGRCQPPAIIFVGRLTSAPAGVSPSHRLVVDGRAAWPDRQIPDEGLRRIGVVHNGREAATIERLEIHEAIDRTGRRDIDIHLVVLNRRRDLRISEAVLVERPWAVRDEVLLAAPMLNRSWVCTVSVVLFVWPWLTNSTPDGANSEPRSRDCRHRIGLGQQRLDEIVPP